MSDASHQAIKADIDANDVVLFMKGTREMPQCGFSSRVAGVLNYLGVQYKDVNVLADEGIRNGIKSFSDWPTIPQLYVKGEFVGGCDIITEMTLSGELDELLAVADDPAALRQGRVRGRVRYHPRDVPARRVGPAPRRKGRRLRQGQDDRLKPSLEHAISKSALR